MSDEKAESAPPPLTQADADALYINVSGDAMKGPLTVNDPTEAQHAASKAYVDAKIAAIPQPDPPADPPVVQPEPPIVIVQPPDPPASQPSAAFFAGHRAQIDRRKEREAKTEKIFGRRNIGRVSAR